MRPASFKLILAIALACTSAATPGSRLLAVKAKAMNAGYSADLTALAEAARDARAIAAERPELAAMAHYWAGYALWQRAVNDVNRKVDPAADRDAALAELDAALAAREKFADAHALAAWLHGWFFMANEGDKDEHRKVMRAHLARARELEPDNPRVLWVYAYALQRADRDKSFRTFDELTRRPDTPAPQSLQPDWGVPEATMTLASIHSMTDGGDLALANKLAHKALALRPGWYYVETILPAKARMSITYARHRTFTSDLRLTWALARRLLHLPGQESAWRPGNARS